MKYVFSLALVAFSLRLAAQTNVPAPSPVVSGDKLFYAQKVVKYKRMKTIGPVMTVAGAILVVVGISNMMSAEYQTNPYTMQRTSNDSKAASGSLMFIGGAGLIGGGIPLTIIGAKKSKKWQSKLDGLTFNYKLAPNQQGFTLSYKF